MKLDPRCVCCLVISSVWNPIHTSCERECEKNFDVTWLFHSECFARVEHKSTDAYYFLRICDLKNLYRIRRKYEPGLVLFYKFCLCLLHWETMGHTAFSLTCRLALLRYRSLLHDCQPIIHAVWTWPNFIELLSTQIGLAWNFFPDKNMITNQISICCILLDTGIQLLFA